MDCVKYIQLDALHNREHTSNTTVFVELLGRVAEQQAAFVCPHVQDDFVHDVAEALEIGNLLGIVPADGQEVTQNCITLCPAGLYSNMAAIFS